MTDAPLTFGLFSKGRQKEQAEEWLADCGLALEAEGGERELCGDHQRPARTCAYCCCPPATLAAGLDYR